MSHKSGSIKGCWLLVVGCWLLVVGCWLLVVGCWLLGKTLEVQEELISNPLASELSIFSFFLLMRGSRETLYVATVSHYKNNNTKIE
ncbi:MAG TPA: hypothetical protein DCY91_06355 [Cyanobacteria bacterium UBA11370]|nr:hypothetical protein [Cyanobacteria bacterium UBA11370]